VTRPTRRINRHAEKRGSRPGGAGTDAAGVTWALLHRRETETRRLPFEAIGLVLLIVWELTDEHPAVDLSLFARRNFTVVQLWRIICNPSIRRVFPH
jgi:hypothetical protein